MDKLITLIYIYIYMPHTSFHGQIFCIFGSDYILFPVGPYLIMTVPVTVFIKLGVGLGWRTARDICTTWYSRAEN